MTKLITLALAAGFTLAASSASAAYATAFSRAEVTWKAQDAAGKEYDKVWTTADFSDSCGTNCRMYTVFDVLPVNSDNGLPVYKLDFTYGRLWKNGTDGTDPYYSSDFDFRNTNGTWGAEDYSNNYVSGSGRRYYGYRNYGTDLSCGYGHEIQFDYKYTSGFSWCQRRIQFYYIGNS